MEHPADAPRLRRRRPALAAWALCSAAALSACNSSESSKKKDGPVAIDDLDVVSIQTEDLAIGEFLAKIDLAMRAWTRLAQTAANAEERRQARELERFLRHQTSQRRAELVVQLETGPPYNRVRSASALGFTDASALSPLLAALSDPEPDVVHNALLGLALLADPTTPLEPISALLQGDSDPHTRANAAYALRSVIEAGAGAGPALDAARQGLIDSEPLVRVQAALILGLAADGESIEALNDQLYDPTPLVSRAAIEAMVLIAERDPSQRGRVARALVAAVDHAPSMVRSPAKAALLQVAGEDHGEREEWVRWAQGLP
jgi:HEAT repeat protein